MPQTVVVHMRMQALKGIWGDYKDILGRIEVRREVFVENLALSLHRRICWSASVPEQQLWSGKRDGSIFKLTILLYSVAKGY